ncbi:MAG: glycoside-pentoside-hexuronide (GPH):cation symporter [Lachnospiraceae bacterium]|nr:glycoside-pentoside-hexuronide (GPH):cation symporter [Lachnospiraceae bacterium]
MDNTKNVKPFGLKDKIGYLFGDFGNDFTFILSSAILMKFYTDVMGVSAGIVGLMMMAARFVDAFTDVAMGEITDKSKSTPKGKFAPWIRRMMGPVAVASVLMYASWFADMPMGFKIFWMFFSYLLWGSVCYTGINIPYGSMASAITSDPKERQSLSTFRTIGGSMAGVMVGVIVPLIVYYTDESGNTVISGSKVTTVAIVFSILAVICYSLCYALTTERVKMDAVHEKFSFKSLIEVTFANRSMVSIIVAALLLLLAQLTLSSMGNYIYPNYFGNSMALSLSGILGVGVVLIFSPFVSKLTGKFGRKEVATFGAFVGFGALMVAYIMHTHNVVIFLVLSTISFVGQALFNLVVWAMITDVIDDIEVTKGKRRDGIIYAVYSFARKLGQAAAAGISGLLLTMIGYTQETAFDEGVVDGIYNITVLVPMLGFAALALVLIFAYPLSKAKVEENAKILAERKANEK